MEKITNLLVGGGGIALIESTPAIVSATPLDVPSIAQTIIQIIIGVVTLLGLFKKKRV